MGPGGTAQHGRLEFHQPAVTPAARIAADVVLRGAAASRESGNRIGASMFLETMPALANSANLGTYLRIGSINFQSLGTEVAFWF